MTYQSSTRGPRLAFVILLLSVAAGSRARAEDGLEKALSVSVNVAHEYSDRVRDASVPGSSAGADGTMLGGTALISVGKLAFGGGADLSSPTGGLTSTTFGALAGARLEGGPRARVLLLGEVGQRTFQGVSNSFFGHATVTPDQLSLPYVGVRAGVTWLVSSHFDLGAMAFIRRDIGQGRMTIEQAPFLDLPHSDTTSGTMVQTVGGTALGLSLQVGFRFDTRRPLSSLE